MLVGLSRRRHHGTVLVDRRQLAVLEVPVAQLESSELLDEDRAVAAVGPALRPGRGEEMNRESVRRPLVAVVQQQSHSARPVRRTHPAAVVAAGEQRSRGRRLAHRVRAEPGAFVLHDTAAATRIGLSPTATAVVTRIRLSATTAAPRVGLTATAAATRIRLRATGIRLPATGIRLPASAGSSI